MAKRVITKVIISVLTGEVLEEESFEYSGPWEKLDGGGGLMRAPSSEGSSMKPYDQQMVDDLPAPLNN